MALPPPLPLDNKGVIAVVVCGIIFPTLSTLCVIGRFVARHKKSVPLCADDWIVAVALLALYGHGTLVLMSPFYAGIGHHVNELGLENLKLLFQILAAVQFTFGLSLGLAKISLCLLLMRIFSVPIFRRIAWIVITYVAGWMIMGICIGAALCRPFAYNWDKTIPGGKCGALDPAYISIAALDIVGDGMIIVLPIPFIWKLKISMSHKIAISCVFALGLLDIIVSILRIAYLLQTSFILPEDFTVKAIGVWLWSLIEPSLAVVVACAPTLRPLFTPWFPNLRQMRYKWSKNYSRSTGDDFIQQDSSEYLLNALVGRDLALGDNDSVQYHSKAVAEPANKCENANSTSFWEDGLDQETIRVDNEVSVHTSPVSRLGPNDAFRAVMPMT